MKRPFFLAFALALASAGILSGCKQDRDASLEGNWKLTNRQCECLPSPTPNEMATFTANGFSFYKDGQLVAEGVYRHTMATLCGSNAPTPALALCFTHAGHSDACATPSATVGSDGTALVLDYGGPCDAPVDTYVRLP